MKELELKYGTNPNQKPARIFAESGELPITVLNGKPGYINFLDALNSYALVSELKAATGLPAAASFKHVSPAGTAIGLPLSDIERAMFFAPEGELSPIACAYIRARGADRVSSYGDWAALSDICDADTARFLRDEVSDGIIAPGYSAEALDILRTKKKGGYNIVSIDAKYVPAPIERRNVYGITFEQSRNDIIIGKQLLRNIVTREKHLPEEAVRDLIVAMIALKYTQSNSVALALNGGTIGIGAGQQSRIHCTRLACDKARSFSMRQHIIKLGVSIPTGNSRPERDNAIDDYITNEIGHTGDYPSLNGVSLASDAFFPFGDNIECAGAAGVRYIAQPGGSIRDDNVIETCDKYGIAMAFTGVRLFTH